MHRRHLATEPRPTSRPSRRVEQTVRRPLVGYTAVATPDRDESARSWRTPIPRSSKLNDPDRGRFEMDTGHIESGEWCDPVMSLQVLVGTVVALDQGRNPGDDLDHCRHLTFITRFRAMPLQEMLNSRATDRNCTLANRL